MYGKNAITKQDLGDGNTLRVREIFYSIQGEGPRAGQPAVFIRLHGCNLSCYFCDTDFDSIYSTMDVASVISNVMYFNGEEFSPLVVITGGEPMLQNIAPLCDALVLAGYAVQIETAGTVWVPGLTEAVEIVCSPKTKFVNSHIEQRCRHWKYLARAGELCGFDGLPKYSTQQEEIDNRLYRARQGTIYLQPMDAGPNRPKANQANMEAAVRACLRFGYRLSLQLHKIAGVE